MKSLSKILVLSLLFVLAFGAAKPAKAFYLEIPQSIKNLFTLPTPNKALAQEAGTYQGIGPAPGTGTGYQGIGPDPSIRTGPQPGTESGYQGIGPDPSIYIGTHPGTQTGPQDQQGQQGQNPEDSAKQLEQMKRGMKQMARQVKQFEQMIASAEKKGTAIPEEIKQKLEKLKSIVDSVSNATSMEELQDVDMSEMQDLMQSLEDFRRDTIEKAQQIEGIKRAVKGMEQGLKFFERQVAALAKKGIAVPADILEHIAKLKSVIEKVKVATSFEDIQEDMESMQDLMETFDQDRQQLEMLARWPQTLKQIDRQLSQLTRELSKSKSIVDRLAKKGIDIQSEYTAFEEGVNKLKSVRDDAVAKMVAGNSDDAFSVLEDDFFGQMDDVWQHQKVIMLMSNLGRFASEFKQNVNRSIATIKNLRRKKVDTSDLEALLLKANEKGQEILNMLNAEELNEDTITDALDELENIKQEFQAKVDELTGQKEELPWEKGPQQFKDINLPKGFDKFVPQKQTSNEGDQTLVKCSPPPSGLVAWWSGDAVAGATATDIKGGSNGTIDRVTLATGKVGNAFKFDGQGGGVKMGNPASLNFGTAPFSLEAWVNWDGSGSSVNNIIRKSNYGPGAGAGYWVRIARDSKTIEFSVGATTATDGQSFISAPISSGAWHHVVATRDSSDVVKLYVDGVSVGTVARQAIKAQSTSESPFALGLWEDQNSEYFSGLIDEASVYNRTLEASEVQAIFNAGSLGKCATHS